MSVFVLSDLNGKESHSSVNSPVIGQDMSDDITENYVFPSLNDDLGMASPTNSPGSSFSNDTEFCDYWAHVGGSTFWMTNYFAKVRSFDWYF